MVNSREQDRSRARVLLPRVLRILTPVGVVAGVAAGFMAVSQATATQSHTVQPGETLSHIAWSYGLSVDELVAVNHLSDPNFIIAGQTLVIPSVGAANPVAAATTYTVQPGDTLSGIASRFGVSVVDLAEWNAIANPNLIVIGQVLTIGPTSSPTAPGGSTGAGGTEYYVVQAGDTLGGIADRFGVTVADLVAKNNIADPNIIHVGQTLVIGGGSTGAVGGPPPPPAPSGTYTVQPGDTLEAIAAAHGVLVRDLVELNGIDDANYIYVGQVLSIPGSPRTVTHYVVSYDVAEDALRSAEAEYGIPRGLLLALSWQESGWQQHVISEAGAVGLMQIMPDTADWALEWLAPGMTQWYSDPYHNAYMGAAILRHWLNLADGDVEFALGAYYQGWHSMETQGPFLETKRYIANVLALWPQFAY